MAIIKCKMCGGDLNIISGESVVECEYCGSRQTVPAADNEKKLTLFARANRLRAGCEFDKAAGVYEAIVADFPEEAEAYWGLVLCKYGIEYVDDPATGRKIPTCHRSSFESILEDSDFEQAQENADVVARKQYREEAKQIEELRKGIIAVSANEQPYDIFICYKETDENGNRTLDSVLAQDIYDALTDKGYRVFFSRISLEDKLGTEYEPYIFAALNSAKIMLAVGTDYEYYNAVWVKNEWSRYLKLMATDKSRHLIPCYKNLDAYDMPKEFVRLQAQDLGKVGAMQDLLRGIEKILPKKGDPAAVMETAPLQTSPNTASLLQRASLFLEDGMWSEADAYCEKVLDIDPQNPTAYLYKLMTECKVRQQEELKNCEKPFDESENYKKILRFGGPALAGELKGYIACIEERHRQKAMLVARKHAQRRKLVKKAECLISTRCACAVGLKNDGTVVAVGRKEYGQCNVFDWRNIVAVSAGEYHTVGLKSDGTVVAVGTNKNRQCDVSNWRDIVAVSAGDAYTVGLKADGTVVAVGSNTFGQCDVSAWTNVVAISAGKSHTVGLKADGTVMTVGSTISGACDVSAWTDIVAISAGFSHTVGLKADGTVVAVGYNGQGQCYVSNWRNIAAISAGGSYTVGLKADGTVVAVGEIQTYRRQFINIDVSGWTDIVAISAGWDHTVGLKTDGTVMAVGENEYGQCDISKWKLFQDIQTLEQERQEADLQEQARQAKKREEERLKMLNSLPKEQATLKEELANLKGLFSGKRRREIEARLAEIANALEYYRNL